MMSWRIRSLLDNSDIKQKVAQDLKIAVAAVEVEVERVWDIQKETRLPKSPQGNSARKLKGDNFFPIIFNIIIQIYCL